jgi:hypothetical protein
MMSIIKNCVLQNLKITRFDKCFTYVRAYIHTDDRYIVVNIIRKWMCAKNPLLFNKKRLSYIKDGDLLRHLKHVTYMLV